MKNTNFSYKGAIPMILLIIMSLSFNACNNKNPVDNTPVSAAGLMAVNLVTDLSAVGIAVSGNLVTASLGYTDYTGEYKAVYTGQRSVQSLNSRTGTLLAETAIEFKDSSFYSMFVVGNGDNVENIITEDKFNVANDKSKAYVRFLNAISSPAQPKVTISSNGTEAFNESAPYRTLSDFKAIEPGTVKVSVIQEDQFINATREINLEAGKIYTVMLTGIPGSIDNDKVVAVKFITNALVQTQ